VSAATATRRRGVLERLAAVWRTEIRAAGNEPRMLAAAAFLVTFLVTRVVTHYLFREHGGGGIEIGSLHIHHMVFGLVLILLSGILDIRDVLQRARAIVFGIGAALVLDEFALILNLADVYWRPEGRESIDAVIVFGGLLGVLVAGGGFWRSAWRELTRGAGAVRQRV
jgi:hypothetical protein